jgi:hypothetical protein
LCRTIWLLGHLGITQETEKYLHIQEVAPDIAIAAKLLPFDLHHIASTPFTNVGRIKAAACGMFAAPNGRICGCEREGAWG